MQSQATEQSYNEHIRPTGLWVTEKVYSMVFSLPKASLANWRYRDRLAGRSEALTGYPIYKFFGAAVRYWLAPGTYDRAQLNAIIRTLPKRKATKISQGSAPSAAL